MHNGTVGLAAGLWELGRGQGGRQFTELAIALLLSTAIGLERAVPQKSAGLRTHTLVGVGSALFMEVSQHGFDILEETTSRGLRVVALTVEGESEPGPDSGGVSTVRLELAGRTGLGRLVTALADLDGVVEVGMVGDDGD
ncbi:MgtC/SapB family protein [Streptomyces sp. NBC_01221]|uniref:MgtC/SapB family protein n=1 Tax=unclassified Streptomyces TaxID=2593676 RepID=UPI0022507F89|nr:MULTISPECIES: MgtC/SapB family protein [unclassified Streptomyces]WSP60338.1 MgtC/SapB family protein [Streptomyces sp. NBC_01241]WSU26279.1 MgtC/SapB family protein [Streptomyces sp. NBC_01108]MCX4791327.1 MgtC/SapB family protein [Streptomyces sp. NBC_01221]MCX4792963.1 MgtC/SapB family protein [Streptomyces sp. NBC_01242]WSP67187.1 MgtC/SapB family protein [Streptomyces sp. NBC_01240]